MPSGNTCKADVDRKQVRKAWIKATSSEKPRKLECEGLPLGGMYPVSEIGKANISF